MPRMNSRTRKKKYAMLVERDGEQCRICLRKPPEVELDIDHKDNNNGNNADENLQLLCTSHNIKKNPRGKGRRKHSSDILEEPIPTSWESKKNREYEPGYRHWLYDTLRTTKEGRILLHEAINSGSEKVGCSPMTAKRYLAKICSKLGWAEIYTDDAAGVKFIKFSNGSSLGITADLLGDSE